MINWFLGASCVATFIWLLKVFKVIEYSRLALGSVSAAKEVMLSTAMDDMAKEQAMQSQSITLFKYFFILAAGGGAALLIPLGMLWLLGLVGIASHDAVIGTMFSWQFILASTAVGLLIFWRLQR